MLLLGLAPGSVRADVRAATTVTFPANVALGETGVAASITLSNDNTDEAGPFANLVCNAGDPSPCAPAERGIVLVPACSTITAGGCPPGAADPGVFKIASTGVGRPGSACSDYAFQLAAGDASGTLVVRPLQLGRNVVLSGSGARCVIDFTFDVLKLPTGDADPNTPGSQTAQSTFHTQYSIVGSDAALDTDVITVEPAAAPPTPAAPPPPPPPPTPAAPAAPPPPPTPTPAAGTQPPPRQPPSPTSGSSTEPTPTAPHTRSPAPATTAPPIDTPRSKAAAPDAGASRPRATTGSSAAPQSGPRREPSRAAPEQAPAPRPSAGSDSISGATSERLASYDPRSEPEKTIALLVATFTLMQLASSGGGLARPRGRDARDATAGAGRDDAIGRAASAPSSDMVHEGVDVEFLGAGLGVVARGDRSRTWGWPGTRTLDRVSYALPARLSPRSPLLARVVADGTYLRAMLGSASLLGLLGGLVLGVAAVQDTGGEALPPAAMLTIAIAVLGVFDAAAGMLAVLTFGIGVVMLGGVDTEADLRLMLGLGALWAVVPLLAGAARPLRRAPTRGAAESWERAADFVIASLIGAWVVQSLVLALPGLAGLRLPIAEHANTAAYCVLVALIVRLGLETIAAHLYPKRLDLAEPAELPEPGPLQRILASALRTTIFVFFAYVIVGSSWQLWVGSALFFIPQVLAVYEDRFPNSPRLFRALPRGLVELVLMLFVVSAFAALLLATMDENSDEFLANSFVLLSLPGFLLSLLGLVGREGDERAMGWGKRIAGVGVLIAGVLLSLGMVI